MTASAVATAGRTPGEIDTAISALLQAGGSTYTMDIPLIRRLQPDLLITQALCDVCAVSEGQVHRAVHEQELGARVLTLTPLDLDGVFSSIEEVGRATGRAVAAAELTAGLRRRLDTLRKRTASTPTPRVLALEWTDPPFVGGHWVPEQIEAAGGLDVLGRPRERSFRCTWEQIAEAAPDVVIVLPCGYTLEEVAAHARALWDQPAWRQLPAVTCGAVWAIDASAWFSRPGPRVVEGAEALATILADPLASQALPGAQRLVAPA